MTLTITMAAQNVLSMIVMGLASAVSGQSTLVAGYAGRNNKRLKLGCQVSRSDGASLPPPSNPWHCSRWSDVKTQRSGNRRQAARSQGMGTARGHVGADLAISL